MQENTENTAKKSDKILKTVNIIFIVFSAFLLYVGIFISISFPDVTFDELFFYLNNNKEGDGASAVVLGVATMIVPFILTVLLIVFVEYGIKKLHIDIKGKRIIPVAKRWIRVVISVTLCLAMILGACCLTGAVDFVLASSHPSEFIEKHYINPEGLVKASENKRNIIIVEVESLETTMFSKSHGGAFQYEPISEMYDLLEKGDYFSSDGGTTGTLDIYGSTWTTAALISYTSGIPFKVPASLNNAYHSDNFMNGAYTLGDVLKENGYDNYLVSGARTSFGGVSDYFTRHGDYDIIDINSIWEHGYDVPETQKNEWGFSDEATFRIARSVTEKAAEGEKPFHIIISTIDTHFTGYVYKADDYGYKGSETCHQRKIDNAYATTSRETADFINWLEKQDFYDDTTVLVVGDHTNMSAYYLPDGTKAEKRGRYNLILNSQKETDKLSSRSFTALDFYPTLLSAAGFTVDGGRLGLGTDLYSDIPTFAEIYGIDYLNNEAEKLSDFYNDFILGDDWEKLKELEKEYED